tara:strand:+ start:420 stop:548 length:129 start_codon:yes stop_codon:yes gene_type:complete
MNYGINNIGQIIGTTKNQKQMKEFVLIGFILLNLKKLMDLYK